MFRTLVSIGALALLAGAAPLGAQAVSVRVAAGGAFPVGGARAFRSAGPTTMVAVQRPLGGGPWSLRLGAEWSRLEGQPGPADRVGHYQENDLVTYGASLDAVRALAPGGVQPYLLAGVGAYRLQAVGAEPNKYGTTGALQLGMGIDGNVWRRVNPFAEARLQLHVTDYGSREIQPTVFWPVTVGVRIR